MVEEQDQIEKHLPDSFKALVSKRSPVTASFVKWKDNYLQTVRFMVGREFTIEEIKSAVFALPNNKAPAPDGFPICWDVIKDDLLSFFSEFHLNGKIPKGINSTFLTLIPKKIGASFVHDFRPISLISHTTHKFLYQFPIFLYYSHTIFPIYINTNNDFDISLIFTTSI